MVIQVARSAKISKFADIEDSVRGSKIIIGENVVIDSFVKIKPAGGMGDVVIGDGSYLNPGTVIYTGNGVTIGKGVLIAANCTLAPTNHEYKRRDLTIFEQRFKPSKGGVVIGDDVWLGANCTVLDGARIGKGAVVGAGSLVRGTVEEYAVVGGNPLKVIGRRT